MSVGSLIRIDESIGVKIKLEELDIRRIPNREEKLPILQVLFVESLFGKRIL